VTALLLGLSLPATTTTPVHGAIQRAPASISLEWLLVNPSHPRTLFLDLRDENGTEVFVRSADGGVTFGAIKEPDLAGCLPFAFTPRFAQVYADCGEMGKGGGYTMSSSDGIHWRNMAGNELTISPRNADQWYKVENYGDAPDNGGGCFSTVQVSSDGGVTWTNTRGLPQIAPYDPNNVESQDDNSGGYEVDSLVADPIQPRTVYANYSDCALDETAMVARGKGGGATWKLLPVPHGLQTFAVTTDAHEPGLLVGTTADDGIPADRVYLSSDQGQSWRIATCPGALHGACPFAVVDNVFGAGKSYAVFESGIYAFTGSGPAETRLTISNHLPVPGTEVEDLQGGSRPGDVVYLLAKKADGALQDSLYRSADGGATWHLLTGSRLARLIQS